jgi:hypothetical protein
MKLYRRNPNVSFFITANKSDLHNEFAYEGDREKRKQKERK